MKNTIKLLVLLCITTMTVLTNGQELMTTEFDTPYGDNPAVGKYVEINGARIYYEEYGKGEPLLIIHGNGGSIKDMSNQIDYFKKKYRVIAADNRGQGKSELKTDSLTYEQIANDWEGLVNYLKLDSVDIIGWSDGGIVALMMGMNNHAKIRKIVAMGANLRPDTTAVQAWAVHAVLKEKAIVESKIREKDTTQNWYLPKQLLGLMADQPNIPDADLSKIKAQVLIMAGDEDIIRGKHSLEIYKSIPKAQLCIMPGETHFAPVSSPGLFNEIVDRFLSKPFKRPDSDWTKWQQ